MFQKYYLSFPYDTSLQLPTLLVAQTLLSFQPTDVNTSLFLNKTLCWKLHVKALLSHHLPPIPCRTSQNVAE